MSTSCLTRHVPLIRQDQQTYVDWLVTGGQCFHGLQFLEWWGQMLLVSKLRKGPGNVHSTHLNTSIPAQIERHFVEGIFKCIFINENFSDPHTTFSDYHLVLNWSQLIICKWGDLCQDPFCSLTQRPSRREIIHSATFETCWYHSWIIVDNCYQMKAKSYVGPDMCRESSHRNGTKLSLQTKRIIFTHIILRKCTLCTLPAKKWNIFYFSDFSHFCGVCMVCLHLKYIPTSR